MPGAFQRQEFSFNACGFEFIDDPDSLFVSHVFVFGAVDAQCWGCVGRDPIERASANVLLELAVELHDVSLKSQ